MALSSPTGVDEIVGQVGAEVAGVFFSPAAMLGHIMAHEMGHLLLGPNAIRATASCSPIGRTRMPSLLRGANCFSLALRVNEYELKCWSESGRKRLIGQQRLGNAPGGVASLQN